MNHGGDGAGTGGNRHADKILSSRTAGIGGLGVHLDIEARQAAGSGQKENKGRDGAQLNDAGAHIQITSERQHAKAPVPGQYRRSDAKCDHVRQRVQFATEGAGRVGEARDAAVEKIEDDGDANRLCSLIEVPRIGGRTLNGLRNRVVTSRNVSGGEYGRQDVQALSGPARPVGVL